MYIAKFRFTTLKYQNTQNRAKISQKKKRSMNHLTISLVGISNTKPL